MPQSSNRPESNRSLLFGLLAVQMNFISRDDLLAGMSRWVQDKQKSLGSILVNLGKLTAEQMAALDTLIVQHVKAHGNDVEKSLRALSWASTVASWLTPLDDKDVQAGLSVLLDRQEASTVDQRPEPGGPRYQKLHRHDDGGQGIVWLARDTELERNVALKEIKPDHADQRQARSRLLLEAKVTGQLEHPGVVPIHDVGQDAPGRPYYVMRFLAGGPLSAAIRSFHDADRAPNRDPSERRLAFRQLLRRFVDVCNAVAYAHSRGVIHRDLKPKNVMIGRFGETWVIDWGMTKTGIEVKRAKSPTEEPPVQAPPDDDLDETLPGSLKGTIPYMSPEQALGRTDLGMTSDVYSLGAIFCELLTGQRAYTSDELSPQNRQSAILAKVQKGEFKPPIEVKPNLPPALNAICCKAMSFAMQDRYQTALELANDIEHWLGDEAVSAYPEPVAARLGRWGRRHQKTVAATTASLAAVMLMALVAAVAVSAEQRETEKQRLLAVNAQRETAKQRATAVTNLGIARRQAFEIIRLIETTEPELAFVPALHDRRRELLATATEACRRFLDQEPDDVNLQRQAAQIYRFTANFNRFTNETKEAGRLYKDAVAQLERLAEHELNQAGHRLRLADTLRDYASLDIKLGNLHGAAEKLKRSLRIAVELRQANPRFAPYRRSEALACLNLANIEYRQAKPAELAKPKQTLARAVLLLQELGDAGSDRLPYDPLFLAAALNQRGIIERTAGALPEAEATHKAAVSRLQRMLDQKSKSVNAADVVHFLSECQIEQAKTWARIGKPNYIASAQKNISVAINKLSDLEKNYAKAPVYREAAASAFVARGEIRENAKDLGKAAEDFMTARGMLAPLAQAFADIPDIHADLGKAYAGLGRVARAQGRAKDAAGHFQAAAAELGEACAQTPTDQAYAQALAALPKVP